MSTKTKTLAKSLHTVSVLVAVARHFLDDDNAPCLTIDHCVDMALSILGHEASEDPYSLREAALRQLTKEGR